MEYVFTHIKYTSQQMTHLHTKKVFLDNRILCNNMDIFISGINCLTTIKEKKEKRNWTESSLTC